VGTLRFLLAFAVIIAHTRPMFGFTGIGGSAVPAFFIISGFYMHLILSTKYIGDGSTLLFYQNRSLRLFPIYWVFLIIVGLISTAGYWNDPSNVAKVVLDRLVYAAYRPVSDATDGSWPSILAIIPNLFFIGSEVLRQFWIAPPNSTFSVLHALHAGGDAADNLSGLHRYLIAPQVWSLSVELIFYALVPALVRLQTIWLLLATACLIIGRSVGRDLACWHLLFTTNLWLFLLGMLAYRSLSMISFRRHANIMIAFIPFVYWLAWPVLENSAFAGWLYSTVVGALLLDAACWFLFAAALPALFVLTRNWRTDRAIGELSYPIYICHFWFAYPAMYFGEFAAIAALVSSSAFAWVLLKWVQEPIDRFRERRIARVSTSSCVVAGIAAAPLRA
jgi:peptidoglycan/LPS O-acetylase OafA/YrhL